MSTTYDADTLEQRLDNMSASVAFVSRGAPGGDYRDFYLSVAADLGYPDAAASGLSEQEAEEVEGEMGSLLVPSLDLAADLTGVTPDSYEPPSADVLDVEQQLLALSRQVTGILPDQRFDGYRFTYISVDYTPRDAAALREARGSGRVGVMPPALAHVY